MKVYEVIPNRLWIRGRTNRLSAGVKVALADRLSLTDVVQLAPRPDDDWRDAWDDRVDYGPRVHNHPFPDGAHVPMAVWRLSVMIAGADGSKTLAMCNAGRNRSALFAAMVWLHLHKTATSDEAVQYIRSVRPNALANPAFVMYLVNMRDRKP